MGTFGKTGRMSPPTRAVHVNRRTSLVRLLCAVVLAAPLLLFAVECDPYYGASFANGFLRGVEQRQENATNGWVKLMIFGGEGHRTYLGCLNCPDTETDSIFNVVGEHGSSVSEASIWNPVGSFGSGVSNYSPWNALGSDPPIIVDGNGTSYGYFTVNKLHADRTQLAAALALLDKPD